MGSYTEIAHEVTFWALYLGLALATFVIVERAIFYSRTIGMAKKLVAAMENGARNLPAGLTDKDSVPSRAVRQMLAKRHQLTSRHDLEDLSESVYIDAKAELSKHLWILDTIVTAAPLLGLLGTILGIIDTFTALASSGISDPAGVSAGIGTALFATALGISVALYGLLFHNAFHERVNRITDYMKVLLIRAGMSDHMTLAAAA